MNRTISKKPFRLFFISLFSLGILTAGCAKPPPPPEPPSVPEPPPVLEVPPPEPEILVDLPESDYPFFSDDMDFDELGRSIGQSLVYLSRIPADRSFDFGPDTYTADHLKFSLERFLDFLKTRPDQEQLNRFIREHYRVYQSAGRTPEREVLFTGYFEPVYAGSLKRLKNYKIPVYAVPRDLITVDLSMFSSGLAGRRIIGRVEGNRLVPYPDRRNIQTDETIAKHARVLAWLSDPVDLFFLQVQGSGRVKLPDGRLISLQYAATNGHSYRSIGKLLIDEGRIPLEEMSMQRIREYLTANPAEVNRILNHNPSFVFFRRGAGGPLGNLGVEVTPGRSIATDRQLFPPGALAYIDTEKPLVGGNQNIGDWSPLRRFVLNQDTGGAIKGPGRADLFWGTGPYAETAAGHMKHPGHLYFLILKKDALDP